MARLLGGQMSLGSWVCFCPCDVSFTRLLSQKLHFFTFSQIPFFLRPMKMPRISAFSASSEALQQSQPPWPQGPDSWNITLSRCVWGGGLGILQTHYIHCAFYFYYYYRIFQARVLAWVAISFSRGSSQPRDQTQVSHINRQTLYSLSQVLLLHQLHLKSSGIRSQRLWAPVLRALPGFPPQPWLFSCSISPFWVEVSYIGIQSLSHRANH